MKRRLFILLVLLAVACVTASAQNQTRNRRVTKPSSDQYSDPQTTPEKEGNHVEKKGPSIDSASNGAASNGWGNAPIVAPAGIGESGSGVKRPTSVGPTTALTSPSTKLIERTSMPIESASLRSSPPSTGRNGALAGNPSPGRTLPAAEVYRVGVGDVLDVRVVEMPTRESTLFTVMTGGTIEYPLLSQPLIVVGLTTDQIATRLQTEIKVIDNPQLVVSVRDYASHAVIVTGWVDNPGRKMLRREAMPLYAILAESLPRAEATVATVVRAEKEQQLALSDQKAMATLLLPGDVIKISGDTSVARKYVYVGGQVVASGEKDFREGMTLTQAILACGGASRDAGKTVKISRRNAEGFLTTSDYDLRTIQEGKSPDPLLQSGDRIEVGRVVW